MADDEAPPHADLVGLLTNAKPEIRRIAVANVLTLTVEEPDRMLLRKYEAGKQLSRLVGDLSSIAGDALKCMINISDDAMMLSHMLKAGVIGKVMESLAGEYKHKDLAVELLLNITRLPSGAKEMLQTDTALMGLNVRRLVVWFMKHSEGSSAKPFDKAAHVFENVTQLSAGRELFLDPTRGLFVDMLSQLQSTSDERRVGIAGFIKNCCFHEPALDTLLPEVLPAIMLQLMGREVYTQKERKDLPRAVLKKIGKTEHEQNPSVRRLLVEALQVLASFRPAREAMRAHGVYHVIKKLHYYLEGADDAGKVEEFTELRGDDELTVEAIINIVDFIQRDEGDGTEAVDPELGEARADGEQSGAGGAGAGAGAGAGGGATDAADVADDMAAVELGSDDDDDDDDDVDIDAAMDDVD